MRISGNRLFDTHALIVTLRLAVTGDHNGGFWVWTRIMYWNRDYSRITLTPPDDGEIHPLGHLNIIIVTQSSGQTQRDLSRDNINTE